ncbi:hypothetical protein [Leptolyngbya sp. O-77]|nr:hypothetical protein [Leptolyngbya sp. O-77]
MRRISGWRSPQLPVLYACFILSVPCRSPNVPNTQGVPNQIYLKQKIYI